MDPALDIESLVIMLVAEEDGMHVAPARYKAAGPRKKGGMLSWTYPPEIQPLALPPLTRVGTVGDGNCMLHSILFATSATYRSHDEDSRSIIADKFREVLIAREEELKDLADAFFPEVGGAMALEESFEILHGEREEINLELGLLIARLYGYNFIAVQVQSDLTMRPVRMTMTNRDEALPTIAVNYLGGGVDFGRSGFSEGGHYEVIVSAELGPVTPWAPPASSSSSSSSEKTSGKKKKTRKAPKPIMVHGFNEGQTEYVFAPDSPALMGLLVAFAVSSEGASSQGGGARRRRHMRLTKRRKPIRRYPVV